MADTPVYHDWSKEPTLPLSADPDPGSPLIWLLNPDPDPHWSKLLDPDPHWGEVLDSDPHWGGLLRILFLNRICSEINTDPKHCQQLYGVAQLGYGMAQWLARRPAGRHVPGSAFSGFDLPEYYPEQGICPEAGFVNVQFWEFSDLRFLYGFLKPQVTECGFLSGLPPFSFTVYTNAL